MIPNISRSQGWTRFAASLKLPATMALLAAAASTAHAESYRYFRFTPKALAGGALAIQFSELEFSKGGVKVAYPTGTTAVSSYPDGDGGTVDQTTGLKTEGGAQVLDGNTGTKWFNNANAGVLSTLLIDVGAGKTIDVDGYRLATANDSPERRPVSWLLEGSTDNVTWTTLDTETNYPTPVDLFTYTPVIPFSPTVSFSYSPAIVLNGKSFSLTYSTTRATDLLLLPDGTTEVAAGNTVQVTPPSNAETTYTLSASSSTTGGAPTEASFKVRAVKGATQNYRYVRFTPLKTAGGQIQLADLIFETIDANGNYVSQLTANTVVYDGDAAPDTTDNERPDNLKDDVGTTKWFSGSLRPIVFDFGSAKSFNAYNFRLGGDAATYPDRNPLRWRMEGSSDSKAWKVIEDFSSFDYPMPAINNFLVSEIPFPGTSLPFSFGNVYATRDTKTAGAPTTLHWSVQGESNITLKAGTAAAVSVESNLGSIVVTPPAANTVYTLHAISAADATVTQDATITLSPAATTVPALPNFTDFQTVGQSVVTNGSAKVINDFPSVGITAAGDKLRLSIVPDQGGVSGSAFFANKVSASSGFHTAFDLILATKDRGYGADGLSFIIQNTPSGSADLAVGTATANPCIGDSVNTTAIEFSTWENGIAVPNQAMVKIYKNQVLQTPTYDVTKTTVALHNSQFVPNNFFAANFTGPYTSPAYHVEIDYSASKVLNLTIDGVSVVSNLPLDLGDSVDSSGKAFVGFMASNGGWTEYSDLASWTYTAGTATTPLAITSSSFDFTNKRVTLNFSATSGTKYRITRSATLNGTDWTAIGDVVTAGSSAGTITAPFVLGTKDFFRVEVAP